MTQPNIPVRYDVARKAERQNHGNWYCTTVLEYEDRFEGQILHVGDKESCEQVRDMLPAIAINGEMPIRAHLVVAETNGDPELTNGRPWAFAKGDGESEKGLT